MCIANPCTHTHTHTTLRNMKHVYKTELTFWKEQKAFAEIWRKFSTSCLEYNSNSSTATYLVFPECWNFRWRRIFAYTYCADVSWLKMEGPTAAVKECWSLLAIYLYTFSKCDCLYFCPFTSLYWSLMLEFTLKCPYIFTCVSWPQIMCI